MFLLELLVRVPLSLGITLNDDVVLMGIVCVVFVGE